jgi:ISXO2-like transposase domain/Transposase zinc-ribbon domain
MFQGINAIDFAKRFYNNESCFLYLSELKWKNSFSCPRCGHTKSYKGRTYYYRRCQRCQYDESVTADTIFHKLKIPMLKAFHMAFRISAKKKGMSTYEPATEVGVQQKTAWLFKRKLQAAMQQDSSLKLKGDVDADETIIGGRIPKKQGRSLEDKSALLVVAERLSDGRTGNLRMQQIQNFSARTLKAGLTTMVDDNAIITTDRLPSYKVLAKEMNIIPVFSNLGKSQQELHKQIMLFKSWLRGIHHKCLKQYLFAYADEYVFRFNQRNNRPNIFHRIMGKIVQGRPNTYSMLKRQCD